MACLSRITLPNGTYRDICFGQPDAVVNITRNGLVFTATRADGTTFTFTQQDNSTPSAKRFKENIADITDERANKVLRVNVVTYDYKEDVVDESDRYDRTGVIADDVIDIIPEAVVKDENGDVLSVDYSRFIPYLIRTVQIQQIKIKKLEERLS